MKIIGFVLCFFSSFFRCGMHQQDIVNDAGNPVITHFEGKMMFSEDLGKSWQSLDTYFPEDMVPVTIKSDKNYLYVGSEHAEILTFDLESKQFKGKENTMTAYLNKIPQRANWVSGFFPCASGQYIYTLGIGLFKKENNTSLWVPLNTPPGFYHVDQMKEDNKGNLYLSNHTGVYRSKDKGENWDRVFTYGFATNLIIRDDILYVNGIHGVYTSEDSGTTWTSFSSLTYLTGDLNNVQSTLFDHDDRLYFFKKGFNDLFQKNSENMFFVSNDNGLSWEKHPADAFLKNRKNVQSILFYENKIFCGMDGEVMSSEDNGITWQRVLALPTDEQNATFQIMQAGNKLICVKINNGC